MNPPDRPSVCLVDESIGYVWSREGFSYRGTQGWNGGVRVRDFHPTEWCCGRTLGLNDGRLEYRKRLYAAERLLELFLREKTA